MSSSSRRSSKAVCVNCEKRSASSSSLEKLCSPCLKKLDRADCAYCLKPYHVLERYSSLPADRKICGRCADDEKQFGKPIICEVCKLSSAFNGNQCRHCQSMIRKFGTPIPCQSCGKICAFNKPKEAQDKVGGQTLCHVCTLRYKLNRHKSAGGSTKSASPTVPDGSGGPSANSTSSSTPSSASKRRSEARSSASSADRKRARLDSKPAGAATGGVAAVGAGPMDISATSAAQNALRDEELAELQDRLISVQTELNAYRAAAEDRIRDYQAKITEVRGKMDSLEQQLGIAQKAVLERDVTIGQLKGAITAADGRFKADVDKMRGEFRTQLLDANQRNQQLLEQVRQLEQSLRERGSRDGDDFR